MFKVKGKTFVFTSGDRPRLLISAKPLPENRDLFLQLPGISVAQYVGRFGWVTAVISDDATYETARDLIAESYSVISKRKPPKG